MRHAGPCSPAVSEAGATVRDMSTHVCVWFEDSWPEHCCDCGARSVLVLDDDGNAVLVELDLTTARRATALPISA